MAKKKQKKIQQEVLDSAQKIWLAGLGALSAAEQEGSRMFSSLVEKGKTFEARGRKQIDEVKSRVEETVEKAESSWEKLGATVDDRVEAAIKKLGVPSRNEIQKLTKRVEELTLKVDQLKPKRKPAAKAKKRTPKKTA